MKLLVLAIFLVIFTNSLPSTFDLRVQPEIVKYTNYEVQQQGICSGYAWAKEIAQIVGNAVGLYEEQKMTLSAQHILDCTESDTDLCYQSTLNNIHDAIKRVTLEGITTADCYPNKPFSFPTGFCKRECHNGYPFTFNYYPKFTRYTSFSEIVDLFKKKDKIAVMAVIKVDQLFNYYSPTNAILQSGGPKNIFQYRVAEVLGWKNAQSSTKLILRAGPGAEWGFNGFIDLELSNYSNYIEQFYEVELSDRVGETI